MDSGDKKVVLDGRAMNGAVVKSLPYGRSVVFADNGKGEELLLR